MRSEHTRETKRGGMDLLTFVRFSSPIYFLLSVFIRSIANAQKAATAMGLGMWKGLWGGVVSCCLNLLIAGAPPLEFT